MFVEFLLFLQEYIEWQCVSKDPGIPGMTWCLAYTGRIQIGIQTRCLGRSYYLHDHLQNISRKNDTYVFVLFQL